MVILSLLHPGKKTEYELVQMHALQKEEWTHLASSL